MAGCGFMGLIRKSIEDKEKKIIINMEKNREYGLKDWESDLKKTYHEDIEVVDLEE